MNLDYHDIKLSFVVVAADTLTQQMETDKSQSKVQLRGRQVSFTK